MTQTANKEILVLETIREIEKPFLEALQRTYGEKQGWRICGPASVALTRILTGLTGVPIASNSQEEHLELMLGIYDPRDKPDRLDRIEEQTYVLYSPGDGFVYYIDPIFGLLMQNQGISTGAIKVEKYHIDNLAEELRRNHNIYPFSTEHEGIDQPKSIFHIFPTPQKRMLAFQEMVAALHDERATVPFYALSTGQVFKIGGVELVRIIRQLAPTWTPNVEQVLRIMRQLVMLNHPKLDPSGSEESRPTAPIKNIQKKDYLKIINLSPALYRERFIENVLHIGSGTVKM